MTKEQPSRVTLQLYTITVSWLMWTHSTVNSNCIAGCSQVVKLAGCKAFEAEGKRPQSCSLLEKDVCNELRDNEDSELPSFCPKFRMSCAEIHAANLSAPSGIHNITLSNGTDQEVYCDMEGVNCDGEGGWTRIAYVNMTDNTCPSGLIQQNENSGNFCRGSVPGGCNGAFFKSAITPYNSVCGRIIGYQFGSTFGFLNSFTGMNTAIEGNYLDGVSITHSGASTMGRTHIWSYGAGLSEATTGSVIDCPCNDGFTSGIGAELDEFIGNDYYCESGTSMTTSKFLNDTLWDGEQCNGSEAGCCPDGSKQPWFVKQLNQSTSDDVELRICTSSPSSGSVYIELIEIYVR